MKKEEADKLGISDSLSEYNDWANDECRIYKDLDDLPPSKVVGMAVISASMFLIASTPPISPWMTTRTSSPSVMIALECLHHLARLSKSAVPCLA